MFTMNCELRKSGRFTALVLALSMSLLFLIPCVAFAYEKEVVLGEGYQTLKEKERYKFKTEEVTFKDRFKLDLNFGIGGYYGGSSNLQIYGIDPEIERYVQRLGMTYSENAGVIRLTASYFLTPKLVIYVGVPFGLVLVDKGQEGLAQLFDEDELRFGVGDVSGGITYTLLSGTETRPNIAIAVDIDSTTSKYYSLGDGLWDYTIGTQVNQLLSKSFYIFGMGSYTFRSEKNGIDPGNIVGYGGGIGFLAGQGRIEAGLKTFKYAETKIDNSTLFEKSDNLVFNLNFVTPFGSGKIGGMNLIVGNLEHFKFGRDPIVLEFTIPIL